MKYGTCSRWTLISTEHLIAWTCGLKVPKKVQYIDIRQSLQLTLCTARPLQSLRASSLG